MKINLDIIMHILEKPDDEWQSFIDILDRGYMENFPDYKATKEFYSFCRQEIQRVKKQAGISKALSAINPEGVAEEQAAKTPGNDTQKNTATPTNLLGKTAEPAKEKKGEESSSKKENLLLGGNSPGHGAHGYRDFLSNAELIQVPADFPNAHGVGFSQYEPAYRLVITGSMSLKAKIYVLPRRRLVTGELQTTALPKGVGPLYGRIDAEGVASLVFSHYKLGATHYGISSLHNACGIPLSPSTQWDAIEKGANAVFRVHKELYQLLANAEVIQIDSTGKKVMSLKKEILEHQDKAKEAGKNPDLVRHGIRTTSVLGTTQSQEKISIFVTGKEHAGEVLDKLLPNRTNSEDVLLACDGSSQNTDTKFRDILTVCLCNAHAYRKFAECENDYPSLIPEIIKAYQKVFDSERFCVDKDIKGADRLEYHRRNSLSSMMEIYQKLTFWQERKLFTPKSALGQASRYFLKNFEELCAFLNHIGAPLHNNDNEIEIKVSVKHRKNSLFYKTETGAHIGDIWMSLIQTAMLNKINPWAWIVDLLRNPEHVSQNPKAWLPWNWKTLEVAT
jgi:hypothetical protein